MTRARDLANIADGDITGTLTLDDIVLSNDMSVADDGKVQFGAGNDLQIYHDASHSYIVDAGTGNFYLSTNGNGIVMQASLSETMFAALPDGAVTLYHDNAAKLATTSTGVDVTGTVGINTASPAYTIDAASSGNTQIHLKASGQSDGLEIGQLSADGGNAITATNNNYLKFGTNNTERLRIIADGSVGIGNSTPSSFSQNGSQRLVVGSGSGTQGLTVYAGNTSYSAISFADGTSGAAQYAGFLNYNHNGDHLQIGVGASERMRITSGGSVGIGTSNPDATAHLEATNASLLLSNSGRSQFFRIQNNETNDALVFNANDTSERMRIDSSGLVGIGVVPSGTAKLQVNGQIYASADGSASAPAFAVNDGDTGMFRAANNTLAFSTGGSERMRLDSSGRVGIGAASSNQTLHVQGNGARIVNSSDTDALHLFGFSSNDAVGSLYSAGGSHMIKLNTNGASFFQGGSVGIGTASPSATLEINGSSTNDNLGATYVRNNNNANNACVAAFATAATSTSTSNVIIRFGSDSYSSGQGMITAAGSGAVAFGSFSDRSLKENIANLPSQLASIMALRPVEFDYIESEGGGHQIGFIAQEVETVYPDLVGENDDGIKMLAGFDRTTARLVKALQEAIAKIETLETQRADLEARLTALENA